MKHYIDAEGQVFAYDEGQDTEQAIEGKSLIEGTAVDAARDAWRAKKFAELNYAQRRATEYPPMADYLDAAVKGDQAQMQAYIDACLAVKARHPKP